MRNPDTWEMFQLKTWLDEDFEALSTAARLLFIWSWTSPASSICGLYEASPKRLRRALGRDHEQLGDALKELARKPMVLYDDDAEVLWVVNRARHANRSPKVAVAMRREFEAVPACTLKDQFAEMHGKAIGLTTTERRTQ